jgi:hypothetical protein
MSEQVHNLADRPVNTRHTVLPESQFYWGVIGDAVRPVTRRAGARVGGDALRFAFEEYLPVAVESVVSAAVRVGDRFIVCALPREDVQRHSGPSTRTLSPATIPRWVLEQAAATGPALPPTWRLNVLTGADEPPGVRRARRRQVLHLAAGAALLLLVGAVGLQRRIDHLAGAASAALQRTGDVYARVLPPSPSAQPPAVRLASELRALERVTIRQDAIGQPDEAGFDAALALSRLLARIPDMHLATDSIDVLPARATIVAVVPGPDDAQRLAAAFDMPVSKDHAWRLRQPQIVSERAPDGSQAVRVMLTLEATNPGPHVAPEEAQ